MTNEELAALIQAGEQDRMEELWRNVERFVWRQAGRSEDLYQSGYLALVDAVNTYDAGRGMSFIGWLAVALKNAFNTAAGRRSERQRRDPIHQAVSADAPAYQDGPTVAELVPDESAALAFTGVEYLDFLDYCRRVIVAALDALPPVQGALLRLHYLEGRTLEEAAPLCGLSCKQAASDTESRALLRLERGKYRRELRECLEAFQDFQEYQEAAGRETWKRTGLSRTEAAALVSVGGMRDG